MRKIDPVPELFASSNRLMTFEEFEAIGDHPVERERQRMARGAGLNNVADAIGNQYVKATLLDMARLLKDVRYTIIGGVASGVYMMPRNTDDIDIAVETSSIDEVKRMLAPKFKKVSPNRMEHVGTGVLVELVNSGWIGDIDEKVVTSAIDDAIPHSVGGVVAPVASPRHLIAMKLPRASRGGSRGLMDQSDIISVVKKHGRQDLTGLVADADLLDLYERLVAGAKS
jgi:hypothetical protein